MIGYLPDVPEFYGYMNAREYLSFIGDICRYRGNIKERADELLELVGLKDAAKRRIKGYSRGMKQRLGIAQALFAKPKLLICDEPTSALDPVGRKEILDLLVAAKKETTVLFSTHILSDVERIADEIAMLDEGVIKFAGAPEDVLSTGDNGFTLSFDGSVKMDEVLAVLAEKNVVPVKAEKNEMSLEELFVRETGHKPAE
jgi:ABC-2 type transport system ATP-binding protein